MSKLLNFTTLYKKTLLTDQQNKTAEDGNKNAEFVELWEPQEDKTVTGTSNNLVRCGCGIIIVFHWTGCGKLWKHKETLVRSFTLDTSEKRNY